MRVGGGYARRKSGHAAFDRPFTGAGCATVWSQPEIRNNEEERHMKVKILAAASFMAIASAGAIAQDAFPSRSITMSASFKKYNAPAVQMPCTAQMTGFHTFWCQEVKCRSKSSRWTTTAPGDRPGFGEFCFFGIFMLTI